MKKTGLPKVLDLTSNTPIKMMDHRFSGIKAWIKEELSEADWKIKFTQKALEEIRTMTDMISANPLPIHLQRTWRIRNSRTEKDFFKSKK